MSERHEKKRLYNSIRWFKLRSRQLKKAPLCRMCQEDGHVVAATVVDHIVPHRGREELFFDPDNLQSICKTHHDSTKQRMEKRELSDFGCHADGMPRDRSHHWYREDLT